MNSLVMKSFELSMAVTTSSFYSKENVYKVKMEKRLESLQLGGISKLDVFSDNAASEEIENELILRGIKRKRYYIKILNKIFESIENVWYNYWII